MNCITKFFYERLRIGRGRIASVFGSLVYRNVSFTELIASYPSSNTKTCAPDSRSIFTHQWSWICEMFQDCLALCRRLKT